MGRRHPLVFFPTAYYCIMFSIVCHFAVSSRLTRCSFLFCLVCAVQGAHRRVQEELEPSSAAVNILQDIFVELTKNTEREDETRMTEPVQSE